MPVAVADAIDDSLRGLEQFPASVTITRTSEDDFKSRQIIVSIDGERVATLLWGDSITKDLSPGPHRIRLYNTLVWKTVEFSLLPGQQAFFEVTNRLGFGTIPLLLLIGVGPLYMTIRRMDG